MKYECNFLTLIVLCLGRVAIPLTLEFLKRWPTPELARQAKVDDILDVIEPLGFGRTRAAIILRFSRMYSTLLMVFLLCISLL